jgi:hypothetical protein
MMQKGVFAQAVQAAFWPAIYTNGPWYHLFSYTGSQPFTGGAVSELPHVFMWKPFWASENWAALVDDSGRGVGVIEPGVFTMSGGFFGDPGKGGEHDGPTGYIAPNRSEILDWNIQYDFNYDLVLGSLNQIRQAAYKTVRLPRLPSFRFERDRSHLTYLNASDTGWPVKGKLKVLLEKVDPQLISPPMWVPCSHVKRLVLQAAFHTSDLNLQVFWKTQESPEFSESHSTIVQVPQNSKQELSAIELDRLPSFKGTVTGLRIDPEPNGKHGDFIELRRIFFE